MKISHSAAGGDEVQNSKFKIQDSTATGGEGPGRSAAKIPPGAGFQIQSCP